MRYYLLHFKSCPVFTLLILFLNFLQWFEFTDLKRQSTFFGHFVWKLRGFKNVLTHKYEYIMNFVFLVLWNRLLTRISGKFEIYFKINGPNIK